MKHCNEKLFKDYEKCKELGMALRGQNIIIHHFFNRNRINKYQDTILKDDSRNWDIK